jgi:tRNA pseudouridine13 synthase
VDGSLGVLQPGAAAFAVEEIPLYAASGAGEHLYLEVQRCGLTTDHVAAELARACGRPLGAVGFAGRKDRHALTRQWFSVQGADGSALPALRERLQRARCELLQAARHRNKLRLGHLRGNRFRLRLALRDAPDGRCEEARAELAQRLRALAERGLENGFGEQRFGAAGSNLRIARAWACGELAQAVRYLVDPLGAWQLGSPLPPGRASGAQGRVRRALALAPDDPARALRAAGRGLRQLIASSAQSAIFNAVLQARSRELGLHVLRAGDLAQGPGGAPFRCRPERLAELAAQAAPGRLEIAGTGPLPGRSKFLPDPEIDAQERAWSKSTDVDWSWFERGPLASAGARRPLLAAFLEPPRVEPGATARDVELCFALPKGCYATEVLRQLGIAGRHGEREDAADTDAGPS